jgi:ATP-dependent DNA ligase
MTEQPTKVITKGKSTRTVAQQCELEFNHLIQEKLDKGYKVWDKPLNETTEQELQEFLGEVITNQTGVPKPMLAKQADKVNDVKIYDKEWYASTKIDGLRAIIYMGEDGELHTSSRGGKNYDAAMCEILSHSTLIQIFKDYPGLMMDIECFKYGLSLQQINSVARTQVTAVDYEVLQAYWYDIVDTTKTFRDRLALINEIASKYNLGYEPEREFKYGELRVQVVPHVLVSGWDNIMKLHNDYVEQGWEGVVIRDPDAYYQPNARNNSMIKVKVYQDDTFKVVDIEQGLRQYDDMVFILELTDGRRFKAKPYGDHDQKIEYTENFDKYKNQYADCKFFYYSDDGIPLQPNLRNFRIQEDLPLHS